MSSVFFVAFQCCQCSTMQVKQRNKKSTKSSSNKWTCVVCNQKQSVRKVFAQGPMAKHLRSFVQSFNMSRQSQQRFTIDDDDDEDDRITQLTKKPRTDWSDYLDRPNDDSHTNNNIDEDENDVASKWSEYTSEGGNDVPRSSKRRFGDDDAAPWNDAALQTITDDQTVEDDVHPDFL
ncbi:hypothetical protein FNV43_RR12562 [Rhamnella rubrinervis]|uniref:MRN complex-interacting protein N-terminal domain-containing protein n=1 Tax=Rhamnella rubrinervis TaxID=2594499 RepID=A0A8K0H7J2_9ROSA|nr:hypothetical protein FNV43_RR12562 [Rhamnella rubrinervis]